MKVLLLGDFFPCPTGSANVNYHLAKIFKKMNHEVYVHTHIAGLPKNYTIENIPVFGGMSGKFDFKHLNLLLQNISPNLAILSGTWFLWREVTASLAFCNIPFITYTVCEGLVQPDYCGCLNFAEKLYVPSNFVKEQLTECVRAKKIEILPHGIDLEIFKPQGEPEGYIFYPARYDDERKQVHKLVEAYTRFIYPKKQIKLMVSGKPNPPSYLKDHIVGTWNRNDFHPTSHTPSYHRMAYLYNKANVVLNVGEAEGFGLLSVEAMACAKPVITFDTHPYNEIVKDKLFLLKVAERRFKTTKAIMGNEFVYPQYFANLFDPLELAEKILWILDNPKIVEEKKETWRKIAEEKYDYSKNYTKIVKECERIVG